MTVFYSSYQSYVVEKDDSHSPIPPGWYVCSIAPYGEDVWYFSDTPLPSDPYATQRDCDIAIRSLSDAGVDTEEAFQELSEEEARRICCGNLLW